MSEGGVTWDQQAATFDDEPAVLDAWAALLGSLLPGPPASIADLGCGTRRLSVLLAQAGHDVHGVDSSSRMLAEASRQAARAGVTVSLRQGDAAQPPLPTGSFDVVLTRHVLWALPDPSAALATWVTVASSSSRAAG